MTQHRRVQARGAVTVALALLLLWAAGVPAGATGAVRVSRGVEGLVEIQSVSVTPDSRTAVFVAQSRAGSKLGLNLYAASVAQGGARLLATDLWPGLAVHEAPMDFAISGDSAYVLFRRDRDVDGRAGLFAARLSGGTPVRLDPAHADGVALADYTAVPRAGRAVFVVSDAGRQHLYSAPLAGGPATRLNHPLPAFGEVASFEITRDGARVVYVADATDDGRHELFSVPVAGGETTRLSPPAVAPHQAVVAYTLAGQRVAYVTGTNEGFWARGCPRWLCDTTGPHPPVRARLIRSVLVTGGGQVDLARRSDARLRPGLLASPDGARVLYFRGKDLMTVPVAGGVPVRLSPPAPDGAQGVKQARFTRDGRNVVFSHDAVPDWPGYFFEHLYAVPSAGGRRIDLTAGLVSKAPVRPYTQLGSVTGGFERNDSTVVVKTHSVLANGAGSSDVYAVDVTTGARQRIVRVAGDTTAQVGRDASRLVYTSLPTGQPRAVPLAGGASTPVNNAGAADVVLTPAGRHALWFRYIGARDTADPHLFSRYLGR